MKNESFKLSFNNYEVIKANLQKNMNIDNLKDSSDIGFLLKIVPNKDKNFDKVNIILGVKISPSMSFNYLIETILKGNFVLINCQSDEERIGLLKVNATAILFPYIRSFVSMLTSQLEGEQILLPVMNIFELVKDIPKNELILKSSNFEKFE
ncbi:MAG: protein-export chaperone SecB [Peptostreptococcaceae bacterium]|nr:protein-export chaperone SecB [Peptostreptococcaceae bacterium]